MTTTTYHLPPTTPYITAGGDDLEELLTVGQEASSVGHFHLLLHLLPTRSRHDRGKEPPNKLPFTGQTHVAVTMRVYNGSSVLLHTD